MRRKFKPKKKFKTKKIFIIFNILLIYLILNFSISKIKLYNSEEIIVTYLLESNITERKKNIFNNIYKKINKNVFNSPLLILETELNYIQQKKEEVEETSVNEEKYPKVYIYNSHQSEQYNYEYLENYNIIPNVLMASLILKDKLENLNITTIVEENDILEYMKQNNLNHAGSYIASRYFLNKVIEQYDSIELYIDLHRDSATHNVTYTNINGKDCAKVLFVIGLENPNYEYNLSVVTKINNIIKEKYPTLTRGILKKQGYGVNGVYNQDLDHNVILIEIGGLENNIDEVNNTLSIIAEVIGEYLNEKEEEK